MANHVIRDRIWVSDKLAKCSLNAALAFPWIFLVSDDWGRFEYRPRAIWGQVFGSREDVTVEDVRGWLAEYEREKLLVRYHMDGDLAYWRGFEGRPENRRRKSRYPDPKSFEGVKLETTATEPRETARNRAEMLPLAEIEQEQESRDGVAPAAPSWSTEACGEWKHFLGTPPGGRIGNALKPLVEEHTWDVVRPLWRGYLEEAVLSPEDPKWTKPETFAQTFKARLARSRAGHGAALVRIGASGLPPPSAKDVRRRAALVAGVMGGLKGDGTFGGES